MAGGITAAVIGGAAVLGGAYMSSQASSKAAQAQSEAARYGADAQSQAAIYSAELQKEALDKQIALSEPFRTAGTSAVNQLSALYGQGGEMYNQQYTPEEFKYDQFTDPGTAFRLKEGMKAMNATAAARGGLISGNALRAGQAFGQELGSQEYQNAFNRYLSNNANKFAAYQANFANRLERAFLEQNMDTTISVSGENNEILTINYIFAGRVFAHNFNKSSMSQVVKDAGFKEVVFENDYSDDIWRTRY
jgi:hypothetical protein